jgi:hypothetical protein
MDAPAIVVLRKGFVLAGEGDLFVVSRVTVFGSVPLYHFTRDDTVTRYLAMVDLVRHHDLYANEVADAFDVHRATLHRMLNRFAEQGVRGLLPGKGRRMPTKIKDAVERRLLELNRQGVSNRDAARRLGLSSRGVEHALRRLAPKRTPTFSDPADDQPVLPMEADGPQTSAGAPHVGPVASVPGGASPEPALDEPTCDQQPSRTVASSSVDVDPLNRQGDRLMARLGLLDDAAPLFAPGVVPRGGVLLAVPVLLASGIFEVAPKVYGSIGPAFYGLRTSILAFLLMALLRVKRAENLKEVAPAELGRVLGLDRAPEMKTLRGKLAELAARGKSLEFMRLLAHIRAKEHAKDLAYLYIDGHVRVYSGKEEIPKTYVMQRRLAMPGTIDYWVNDQRGQPLLVITAEANEGLSKMLMPVLAEVRGVIGDRRATVAFDRGGWNLKLFKELIKDGNWDILTYRKGSSSPVPRKSFRMHKARIDGREVSYELSEKNVRIGGMTLRQVTVLGKNDHQTHILTSKKGVPAIEIAYRMFDRWRQENYFKYMEAEFSLDALVEYGTEEADPNRMVPNPKRKAIDKELAAAKAEAAKLERNLGAAAFDNEEGKRRTMRGFKIATGGTIGKPLREAREKVQEILARRQTIPKRVTVTEALDDKPTRLCTESKRLSDTLKMVAYQAETALVDLLRPHYRRTGDEGRKLIATALKSAVELSIHEGELRVTLAALSSPHRTRAIDSLCEELNRLNAHYPGTNLRLRYAVAGPKV